MNTQSTTRIEVGLASDPGQVRELNEDYAAYRVPHEARLLAERGALFVVADGVGGHAAGEVASRAAVETLIDAYYGLESGEPLEGLTEAVRAANSVIFEQAHQGAAQANMGTTLVAAVILGQELHIAHVGDSRAYRVSAGRIVQLTEDHSWVAERVRAGLLTGDEARQHPQRHVITRALGQAEALTVDTHTGRMRAGDSLVLCSDGLTNHVSDDEIRDAVLQHPPQRAAQALVDAANERGGLDNITVLIARLSQSREAVIEPSLDTAATQTVPVATQRQKRRGCLAIVLATLAKVLR